MNAMIEICLPGGLLHDGCLNKRAIFSPLTGYLEQTFTDTTDQFGINPPRAVSRILTQALNSIAEQQATPETVAALCVADRQYLMLCLARQLEGDSLWLHPACEQCGVVFDIFIQRSALPIKTSGKGFPFVKVLFRKGTLHLRVPTGADQESIVGKNDDEAIKELLSRCVISVNGSKQINEIIDSISERELCMIEEAMDAVAPDIGTRVVSNCPECGHEQIVALDPYNIGSAIKQDLYQEVHALAYNYHWAESEILSLPRERRHLYLRLIDHDRGVYT